MSPCSDWAYENSLCVTTLCSPFLGAAFLLMDAKECLMSAEEIFLTKIDKFISIHQNSFLVLFAPLHGPEEWNLMFRIQQRYGSKAQPRFLFLLFLFFFTLLCLLQFSMLVGSFVLLEGTLYNLSNIIRQGRQLFLKSRWLELILWWT